MAAFIEIAVDRLQPDDDGAHSSVAIWRKRERSHGAVLDTVSTFQDDKHESGKSLLVWPGLRFKHRWSE